MIGARGLFRSSAATTQLPSPATCRVGRARVVITPPVGTSLAGYFRDRKATAVRDDLYANAVVIQAGGERLAIVSCDLLTPFAPVTERARRLAQERTGIPPDHILVCTTHTHTGPEVRDGTVVPVCEEWRSELPGRIAEAIARAADKMVPATLRAGSTELHDYSFNRLFRLVDGSEQFGRGGRGEEILGTAGPIDPQVLTLGAVGEDGRLLALLVNFALHADVIGGISADFISADWPGAVARNIAAVYGDETVTLFLQGAAGDINHFPHQPTNLPTGGPAKAEQLGRAVAGAAMVAHERAEPMTSLELRARLQNLSVPYYTRDAALAAEIEELKAKDHLGDFERFLVERFESWPYDGQDAEVPIQVFRIGDVGLVGLPAEIFVRIGLEIKRWSPTRATFVVALANASVSSYIPPVEQAERGAYGAKPILSRRLCAEAGRLVSDAAIRLLHEVARS